MPCDQLPDGIAVELGAIEGRTRGITRTPIQQPISPFEFGR
jgi:hypothetical protein